MCYQAVCSQAFACSRTEPLWFLLVFSSTQTSTSTSPSVEVNIMSTFFFSCSKSLKQHEWKSYSEKSSLTMLRECLERSNVPPTTLGPRILWRLSRRSSKTQPLQLQLDDCPWVKWWAGLASRMKNETGRGRRWQLCHKASVRMTGPKTSVCCGDIPAANRKVQALTAAGPKDGESSQ